MQTAFFYKNIGKQEQELFEEYVMKKLPKLEKLLSHFPPDASRLHIKCERFKKHSAYEVEMTLHLPCETLMAKEASHAITKAVDFAKDRLEMQIKKSSLNVRRVHRRVKARSRMKQRALSLAEQIG